MSAVLLILAVLGLPAVILAAAHRWPILDRIGVVLLCYVVGIALGNSGLIGEDLAGVQDQLSQVTVVLALPLLLFSLDVRAWSRLAGKAILSMVLSMVAVSTVSGGLFLAVRGIRDDAWQLAGMAIGLYTGGTPNLAAVRVALDVDQGTYVLFHTYDTVVALLYLAVVLTVAQRILAWILPRFTGSRAATGADHGEDLASYAVLTRRASWPRLGGAVLLSVAVVSAAVGLGSFLPDSAETGGIILAITTGGIALSLVGPIRRIPGTFQLGMYVIYAFSVAVASMTDLSELASIDGVLLGVVLGATFGTLTLHALLAAVFRIDTDTFLATSVAAICSPPFVPVVAGAIKNPAVILSGLTTGIIGYALGNYLGISLAWLFHALP